MNPGNGLTVALGGGTARAMAHVGVLLALEEAGIRPAAVAGTSFGAIIAALYALGLSAAELQRLLTAPRSRHIWAQALDPAPGAFSLVRGRKLERWLDATLFSAAGFGDATMPLSIATTSLGTGELAALTSGPLARAVVASCSLPLLFAPVNIDGDWLVDGGFVEAVPFRAGTLLGAGPVLGISAGIDSERAGMVRLLRSLRQRHWARRLSDWSVARSTASSPGRALRGLGWAARSYARAQLLPERSELLRVDPQIAWWDFHRLELAVEAGLAAGRQALEGGLAERLLWQSAAVEVDRERTGMLAADQPE